MNDRPDDEATDEEYHPVDYCEHCGKPLFSDRLQEAIDSFESY